MQSVNSGLLEDFLLVANSSCVYLEAKMMREGFRTIKLVADKHNEHSVKQRGKRGFVSMNDPFYIREVM